MREEGIIITPGGEIPEEVIAGCMNHMAASARENGMEIVSCAEEIDLTPYGVRPGKCIDDVLIRKLFGLRVSGRKDPGQRRLCNCVLSRGIGVGIGVGPH